MEVLSLQIFVSLVLVLVSILLFFHAAKGRDLEHADRLALLPLDVDERAPTTEVPAGTDRTMGDAAGATEEPR